jgi:hypothetical protein
VITGERRLLAERNSPIWLIWSNDPISPTSRFSGRESLLNLARPRPSGRGLFYCICLWMPVLSTVEERGRAQLFTRPSSGTSRCSATALASMRKFENPHRDGRRVNFTSFWGPETVVFVVDQLSKRTVSAKIRLPENIGVAPGASLPSPASGSQSTSLSAAEELTISRVCRGDSETLPSWRVGTRVLIGRTRAAGHMNRPYRSSPFS